MNLECMVDNACTPSPFQPDFSDFYLHHCSLLLAARRAIYAECPAAADIIAISIFAMMITYRCKAISGRHDNANADIYNSPIFPTFMSAITEHSLHSTIARRHEGLMLATLTAMQYRIVDLR